MRGIASSWVRTGCLLLAVGCGDAVYTLGYLPGDGPGLDASISDGQVGKPDASGGTGGMGGGSGSGATGGSGGAGGTVACQVKRTEAEFKGLNLYLMVDSSIGIAFQPATVPINQAITMFVDDPDNAGLGVGINFYGVSCDPGTYAAPRVPVAELPAVAAEIRTSFPPIPLMGVGAVIAATVNGAVQYAAALEGGDRDRETDVLIIGDAFFDFSCGEGINEAVAYARGGFTATPSVKTHVIGIDASLIDPLNTSDLTPLDNLAAAGGTGRARRVTVSADSASQIYDALKLATRSAKPCEVKLPNGSVLEHLEMEWLPDGDPVSTPYIWPRLESAAACGPRTGFYPSSNLAYLQLCPAACDTIRAGPRGTLSVREDCP